MCEYEPLRPSNQEKHITKKYIYASHKFSEHELRSREWEKEEEREGESGRVRQTGRERERGREAESERKKERERETQIWYRWYRTKKEKIKSTNVFFDGSEFLDSHTHEEYGTKWSCRKAARDMTVTGLGKDENMKQWTSMNLYILYFIDVPEQTPSSILMRVGARADRLQQVGQRSKLTEWPATACRINKYQQPWEQDKRQKEQDREPPFGIPQVPTLFVWR